MSDEAGTWGDEQEPTATEGEHVPPAIDANAFHCPICGVLANMSWTGLYVGAASMVGWQEDSRLKRVTCSNCHNPSYWVTSFTASGFVWRMVEPRGGGGPRPHPQMPDDVRADYEEARAIVQDSPRGACALLRHALQLLLDDLGQGEKTPDKAIGALVEAGLPVQTQQALDILRVVGNNAVHPLELDLKDDVEAATGLFEVVNFIVQDRIAQPKALAKMFAKLPQGARDAIQRRDTPKN